MKKIVILLIFAGLSIESDNAQIVRQVQPSVIQWLSRNALFFDESSYQNCFNDEINFASYYDPNEPNTQRMNQVLDVSFSTVSDFGSSPYADNCDFGVYYCQMVKTPQDIFCRTFNEFRTNTIGYLIFHYTTFVKCINSINGQPPYENLAIIKRTFYPVPMGGSIFFGNKNIQHKTIEFNKDPGQIDNFPANGGNGSFTYQWMTLSPADPNKTSDIPGATFQNYDPGQMTQTTLFQRKDIPAVCDLSINTDSVFIQVLPNVNPGQIGTSQTICYGSAVSLMNYQSASGGTGTFSYQWQSSADGSNFQDIPNQNDSIYTATNLTTSTYFVRKCTSGSISALSNVVFINVWTALTAGDISNPQTICYGTSPALITCTDPTGGDGNYTYKWEKSINGTMWAAIPGEVGKNYQPPTLSQSTYFHRIAISGSGCGQIITEPNLISVYNPINAGIISPMQIICFGALPSNLLGTTPSGGNGSYSYSWKYSIDGKLWNLVPNALGLNYQPDSLKTTTYYRRDAITNCGTYNTDSIKIEVKSKVNPGIIAQPQTICFNTSPLKLTGSIPSGGFNSFSYQWQNSIDNIAWNNVSGSFWDTLTPLPLIKTTYFRRKATESNCGAFYSNVVLINVHSQVTKPYISVKPFYCFGENVLLTAGSGLPYTFYWYNNTGNLLNTGSQFAISKIAQSLHLYVKAKDSNNCFSDTSQLMLNVDRVIADFSASVTSINPGEPVNFINNSVNASSYLWNFSEGDQSTAKNPWHYFNLVGDKTIRLISYSANQCSDTLTKKNYIHVFPVTAVPAINNSTSLLVYPNPVEDKLWISYGVQGNKSTISVDILDEHGVLLSKSQGTSELILNVASYPPGLYMLIIRVDETIKLVKILKN